MNDVLRSVGQELRRARRAAGLALRDLSSRSDHHFKASAVGGYERAERSISVERFCQLCAVYGVSPAEVLGRVLARSPSFGAVRVDLPTLQAMNHTEAHLLIDLVERVSKRRGQSLDHSIVIRGADLEAVAITAEIAPTDLIGRLQPAISVVS